MSAGAERSAGPGSSAESSGSAGPAGSVRPVDVDGPSGHAVDAPVVAVIVVRAGRLPAGAEEAVAEAAGATIVVGSGASGDETQVPAGASRVWWADTPTSAPMLAALLAPALEGTRLVVLPASPDGRDLAPRLAAELDRPVLAGAVKVGLRDDRIEADLLRADGRVVVPVSTSRPAVATLWPGARPAGPPTAGPQVEPLQLAGTRAAEFSSAIEVLATIEPDPATMDLSDAPRVVAGGAGLVPEGANDEQARSLFGLLGDVAAVLGASAGATRVVTDAGWMGYERQIGTTGVTLRPELYVALGISGASQHVGGIGDPERVVSVNLDASCPMTGLADLGLVADAPAMLVALAERLDVPVAPAIMEMVQR